MIRWLPVTDKLPSPGEGVYLYRVGDLYPVVGFRAGYLTRAQRWSWLLEEGGAEDGSHRRYPLAGPSDWQPTHYKLIDHNELEELSGETEGEA